MTVRCRAGGVTGCPVTVLKPHTPQPERQATSQASCGIAPLIITHLRLPLLATGLPPLVHRPQGPDERSTTVDRPPLPAGPVRHAGGCIQPVLLRGRVDHIDGATGELLTAIPPYTNPAASSGGLQDPARLPLPGVRGDLPRRHLPADPRRPLRRQGHPRHCRRPPVRVRHPHRALLRPGPHPPGERRPAPAAADPAARPDLPHGRPHVLRRQARPRRPPARRTPLPGLLRLHRLGPVQRLRPRAVAPLHHHPAPGPRPPPRV